MITAPLSAAYSALAIDMAGARPVFADIDPERLTLDPGARPKRPSRRARARILPVHLYGQPADMAAPRARSPRATASRWSRTPARRTSPPQRGAPVGRGSAAAAYSFYPTKNLGALGDGGAVTTDDARAGRARSSACATAARRAAITTTNAA